MIDETAWDHCPQCGRFLKDITATIGYKRSYEAIEHVKGTCKVHGIIDLTERDWSGDDFAF